MINNLNKILVYISIITVITGCHTLEHKSIFLVNSDIKTKIIPKKVTLEDKISNENIPKIIQPANKTIKSNIKVTVSKKKVASEDKISKHDLELVTKTKKIIGKIDLKDLKNISEKKLYSKISKGNFIKQEGKLKNIQYYFEECFLDVFLIKRNNIYITDFIQIRSTELNSFIDKEKCLIEIASKLK
jgi:hypothetical protein